MRGRPAQPDTVYFPVVPMLDMAFQLLAFFILTFQSPTGESRIDLDLPAAPAALPEGMVRPSSTAPTPEDTGPETDVMVRARADEAGRLRSLRLGSAVLNGADDLAATLRRLRPRGSGEPLSVALVADDRLLYAEAARLLGACAEAGVSAIRLVPAGETRTPSTGGETP